MYTDASSYSWGNVLDPSGVPLFASDYWLDEVVSSDIAVKEALALAKALSSFTDTIKNSRVDVFHYGSVLMSLRMQLRRTMKVIMTHDY